MVIISWIAIVPRAEPRTLAVAAGAYGDAGAELAGLLGFCGGALAQSAAYQAFDNAGAPQIMAP